MREADPDRDRLHPEAARRDGPADAALRTGNPGKPRTSMTTPGSGTRSPSTTTGRRRREGADGRHPAAFAGMTRRGVRSAAPRVPARSPPHHRPQFRECGYLPMIELLRYLEANGFTSYIASGGDRDFMRPVTDEIYGSLPSGDRQLQRSDATRRRARWHVVYLPRSTCSTMAVKPSRIWSRIGRRPIIAVGNSNGTSRCCATPATGAAGAPPARPPRRSRARVRLHRRRRESRSSRPHSEAGRVSIKNDWTTVFSHPHPGRHLAGLARPIRGRRPAWAVPRRARRRL